MTDRGDKDSMQQFVLTMIRLRIIAIVRSIKHSTRQMADNSKFNVPGNFVFHKVVIIQQDTNVCNIYVY